MTFVLKNENIKKLIFILFFNINIRILAMKMGLQKISILLLYMNDKQFIIVNKLYKVV